MRGLICLWIVALAPLLWGDEGKAGKAPSESATEFDFAAFGRLPVWYNGRVTDWSRVADNLTSRLSSKNEHPGSSEKGNGGRGDEARKSDNQDPPVRLLLNILSGGEDWRSQPLILIEHDHLRSLLRLSDETALPVRLPIKDVKNMEGVEAEYNRILNSGTPWSNKDRQVLDLVDRLRTLQTMLEVLRLPDTSAREAALVALQRDADLRKRPIPLVVPPRRPEEAWTTLAMALVLRDFGEQVGAEPNPAADKILPILATYAANDPAAFNRAVTDYADYLAGLKLEPSPWNMTVPSGWTELGVPPSQEPGYFNDTRRVGATVALLSRWRGEERATLRVNIFPSAVAAREEMINSWRLSNALAPLPAEDLPLLKIDVAGASGWRVALETPEGLPVPSTRMLGAVFSIGSEPGKDSGPKERQETWVVTCEGSPDIVESSAEAFETFLKSLHVETGSRTGESLGLASESPNPVIFGPGLGYAAAFVPVGKTMWVLRGPMIPEVNHEAKREELGRFLKGLLPREPTADNSLPFSWDDLPMWTLRTDSAGRREIRAGSDEFLLAVEVFAAGPESIGSMIRAWRGEFLLPEWSGDELENATKRIDWEGGSATLVTWSLPIKLREGKPPGK